MGITPLVIAGVAGALLVASVGVDLAYSQTLYVDLQQGSSFVELARVTLDSDGYSSSSPFPPSAEPVERNGTLTVRTTLDNGYPWPAPKTIDFTRDGCYEGARPLASATVGSVASGRSGSTVTLQVADLLGSAGGREKPVPVDATASPEYVAFYACLGERYLASPNIPVEASS